MRNPIASIAKRVVKLRKAPFVARRRGARFLLDPKNWIDNRLLAGAAYENRQIDNARRMIDDHGLDTVIDIGANIGLYTVLLGILPGIKQVIAFEPVRRNHAQLMANVFLNDLTARVEAHRVGIGSVAGDVTIHIDPASTGLSRIDVTTAERSRDVFTEVELIRIEVLDDIVTLSGRRAFVKIDIEGHALAALRGMSRFLSSNVVVLQVELQLSERDAVAAFLADQNFELQQTIEGDGVFVRRA